MARLAVLASGNGSNFQALVEALRARSQADPSATRHECVILVHDRRSAYAVERARSIGVPARHVGYIGKTRGEAEAEIDAILRGAGAELVALAGYMRVLGPAFVKAWEGRLVNIHPSLLPAWPGANAIQRAFEAGEERFGVSVHFVDEGMDSGALIAQDEIRKKSGEGLEELETRIHALEHRLYPRVVLDLLDRLETGRRES